MKKTLIFFIFLHFSTFLFAHFYPDTIQGVSVYVYKNIEDDALNLYVLKSANESAPTVVFFFGGGWVRGTVKQFEPHMQYLHDLGLTAIAVDYRVTSRHNSRPVQSVQDAMNAMIFVKNHAADLHVDTTKIAAAGGSAGGHLAAATAILKHYYPKDEQVTPEPDALILFNPVINTMPEGFGRDLMKEDGWVLSPAHHITTNLPPAIIFHGTADKTVPFDNILNFQKKMKAMGNRVEVKSFKERGHAFFNYGRNENKDYQATIVMMHQFLRSIDFVE